MTFSNSHCMTCASREDLEISGALNRPSTTSVQQLGPFSPWLLKLSTIYSCVSGG